MASKKRLLSKLKRLLYNVNVQYTDWLKNEALKLHEPYLDGRNDAEIYLRYREP